MNSRLYAVLLSLFLVAFNCPAETTGTADANLMKSHFPIGVWFDGRVEGINCPEGYHNVPNGLDKAREYYRRNFTDIRDHNLQIIVVPNTPPDYRETLLSVADEVGVKIVLEMVELAYPDFGGKYSVRSGEMIRDEAEMTRYIDSITSGVRKHDSLFCYQVLDEPPAELFENFSLVNRVLKKLDPKHPSFSCLCIEEELPRTAQMGTQMIVFDRYPLRKPGKPGDYDFAPYRSLLDNLDKQAGDLPYWNVVQACAMDTTSGLRYPSQAELRLMTWMSVAHNAKGIFFFLHNSYTQQEKLQGLVDLDMNPHPIYAEVADLSRTLKRLSPLLLKLKRSQDAAIKPREGFDVQHFVNDSTGKSYVWVLNNDVLRSSTFDGEFVDGTGAPAKMRELIVDVPVESDAAKFSLRLPPGGAALLELGGTK